MSVFGEKLTLVSRTIQQAFDADVSELVTSVRESAGRSVVAVGSGGSAVVGEFLAACRGSVGDGPTVVSTPMGFVLDSIRQRLEEVWLFSAGGNNPDILAGFRAAAGRSTAIRIVTSDIGGALAQEAFANARARVHIAPVAEPKDGFLATHSLIAAATVLLRAFDVVAWGDPDVQRRAEVCRFADAVFSAGRREAIRKELSAAGERDMLLLLHDPLLTAGALLVETSCWEAGLCAVERTDFRNFAHGRHVGLQKNRGRMWILALTTDRSRRLWQSIAACLPKDVPVTTLDFGNGGRQKLLEAVLEGLVIIEAVGEHRRIDPGRPGVAEFGRRIYDSRALLEYVEKEDASIKRKRDAQGRMDDVSTFSTDWQAERERFVSNLASAVFRGVVLDYDGTVVETHRRREGPSQETVQSLVRVLEGGVLVAFATGRGGSISETLRPLLPERFWDDVLVGYYNGGYVTTLRTNLAEEPPEAHPELIRLDRWFHDHPELFRGRSAHRFSNVQITVALADLVDPENVRQTLVSEGFPVGSSLAVRTSGHSLDICPADSKKTCVIDAVHARLGDVRFPVLCIGDSGAWRGNDYDLLAGPFSLSVADVCHRPGVCWNLLPEGVSGPAGLAMVMKALIIVRPGEARIDVEQLLTTSAGSAMM
jgi:hypothetical protein